jgi:hypothetical protein
MNETTELAPGPSVTKITAALVKAQAAMTPPKLNRTNPHYKHKYADLTAVIEAVRKPLNDNGIAFTQQTALIGADFVLLTTLRHISGESIVSEWPLPPTTSQQQMGSNLTYAKRYSLAAICGVSADEDDDAEAGTKKSTAALDELLPAAAVYTRIDKKQTERLLAWAKEAEQNMPAFLNLLEARYGIRLDRINDLPQDKYDDAVKLLIMKKDAMAEAGNK